MSGYVYMGPRSVMRIQRGKPANSVTVTCYRHRNCHICLTQANCPSDLVLKQWLFDVPATPEGASVDANRELALRHMQIAKDKWGVRKRKPP